MRSGNIASGVDAGHHEKPFVVLCHRAEEEKRMSSRTLLIFFNGLELRHWVQESHILIAVFRAGVCI